MRGAMSMVSWRRCVTSTATTCGRVSIGRRSTRQRSRSCADARRPPRRAEHGQGRADGGAVDRAVRGRSRWRACTPPARRRRWPMTSLTRSSRRGCCFASAGRPGARRGRRSGWPPATASSSSPQRAGSRPASTRWPTSPGSSPPTSSATVRSPTATSPSPGRAPMRCGRPRSGRTSSTPSGRCSSPVAGSPRRRP